MRKLLILITLLTLTTKLFSQIDSTKIAFIAYWSIGDSYDYKILKTTQQWKEETLTKDEKQSYIATFTVIDSTEDSYTINWSFENDFESTYKIPVELREKFSKYQLTEIKYKTSEVGVFLEIINWIEVRDIMKSMFEDIVEVLGENDEKKKDALQTLLKPLRDIYSTKQGIEQIVLKELQYFHFPMGLEYDITEPLIYDDEIANMFGGKPIRAKAKLYFENVDFDESFCVIKQEMSLDPKDTKEVLKQIFKRMRLEDQEIKKALKTAIFQIKDRNVYEYYFNPGIPLRIETERESILDTDKEKLRRIDKTIIELVYNE